MYHLVTFALVLLSATSCNGVVLTYNAYTGTGPVPIPPLPPLGPAGFVFQDPTFGSTIVRVTGNKTLSYPWRPVFSFMTDSSAEANAWNTDHSMFYILNSGGGVMIFSFDDTTMQSTLLQSNSIGSVWSYVNRSIMYGVYNSGSSSYIVSVDPVTNTIISYMHNITACNPFMTAGRVFGELTINGDDTRFGLWGGGQQDAGTVAYVYDINLGCRWWNLVTGQIAGTWGPNGTVADYDKFNNVTWCGAGIHNARMEMSGRFYRLDVQCNWGGDLDGVGFWEIDTLNAGPVPGVAGHIVNGYNLMLGDNSHGSPPLGFLDIAIWDVTNVTNMPGLSHINWPLYPQSPYYSFDAQYFPGAGEIICMETDNIFQTPPPPRNTTVWRFGHHRSNQNYGFYHTARGNVAQDGEFYMFTSDWEGTLGVDSSGNIRTDVFIIKLAANVTMSPTPFGPLSSSPSTPPSSSSPGPLSSSPSTPPSSSSPRGAVSSGSFIPFAYHSNFILYWMIIFAIVTF